MHYAAYYKARSERGRRMAEIRWERDRARREALAGEAEKEMAQREAAHPRVKKGMAVGSIEYRDFRTGKIMRWTVLLGDRVDRVMLRAPSGACTRSHGWTWVMDHLRRWLCGGGAWRMNGGGGLEADTASGENRAVRTQDK